MYGSSNRTTTTTITSTIRQQSNTLTPPMSPARPHLKQVSHKKGPNKSSKFFRKCRSIFRTLPIVSNPCKFPVHHHHHVGIGRAHDGHIHGGTRMTGTLFGHRKGRINLVMQENPRCLPMVLLELSIPTGKFLQEIGSGLARIALECDKHSHQSEKTKLMDEPIWNLFWNGRKTGYGVKREPTEDDLNVMQMLHAVSMGAGVLPSESPDLPDGEMAYMRAFFERVVGSKDSETYYMMNPDGNNGPDLTIFFVRI